MNELVLMAMVGLPRSGKTTWAKRTGYPIVCPDAIRIALHGERFLASVEPAVWLAARYMISSLFLAGHSCVVFDATNNTRKRRDALTEWGEGAYSVKFVHIDTSKDECIRRATAESDDVIIPVIERMSEEFEPLLEGIEPLIELHASEGMPTA